MSSDITRSRVDDAQASLRALSTEIDRLDGVAAEQFGLNRTDLRALDLIRRSGILAPTALAGALGFTTGGITAVIDRLERAGYVQRTPDPQDRRRLVLEPTTSVMNRESQIYGRLIAETMALFGSYSDSELALITDFLVRCRQTVAAHADRLAAGEPL